MGSPRAGTTKNSRRTSIEGDGREVRVKARGGLSSGVNRIEAVFHGFRDAQSRVATTRRPVEANPRGKRARNNNASVNAKILGAATTAGTSRTWNAWNVRANRSGNPNRFGFGRCDERGEGRRCQINRPDDSAALGGRRRGS